MPRNYGMTPKQRRKLSRDPAKRAGERTAFVIIVITMLLGAALMLHGAAHLIEVLRHG